MSRFTYVQLFEGFSSKMIDTLQMLVIHYNQFSILPEPLYKLTKKNYFKKMWWLTANKLQEKYEKKPKQPKTTKKHKYKS